MPTITPEPDQLEVRSHGAGPATLLYLPGIHGDWTLASSFRTVIARKFRFIEITYPRTVSWSLRQYAEAVFHHLQQVGQKQIWFLGESYSSIVAWELLNVIKANHSEIEIRGIILAGGFVRYPSNLLVGAARQVMLHTPSNLWKVLFWIYARYAVFRHRNAPETKASVSEFVRRRTSQDLRAVAHRLALIRDADLRDTARNCTTPIYALAGGIDPIVPWWHVFPWLRKNCPALQDSQLIWSADHAVLATAPHRAAEIISQWVLAREHQSSRTIPR